MKNVIIYIGIFLLTVYVEIMYVDFYGITLAAFEILLFFTMFLLSWYLKKKVKVGLEVRIPAAHKGEEIQVELHIENRGFLPVTKMHFLIAAENPCNSRKTKIPVTASVPARRQNKEVCQAAAEYCGRYYFRIIKGRVWDYLGLFSHRIGCKEDAYVDVLPGFYHMEIQVSERTRNFPADGEEYDAHRSGDDPSEIFQIREFRDGDTLQRVHWKMSAKTDEWMTKELGRPVGYSVLVLVDFHMEKEGKSRLEKMDAVFEIAAAVSCSMQQAGVRHFVAWFNEKQGGICRACVREEEQVYEMMNCLMGAEPYAQELDLRQIYQEEYPGEQFSRILRLSTEPAVYMDGAEAARFEPGHIEEQISGCLLEV